MEDSKRPTTGTDEVATLVRLAGDSTVARERMERVRAAAKAEWRQKTRRRSRVRRFAWVAAAAAALAAAAFFSGVFDIPGTPPSELVARVEALNGSSWMNAASGSRTITAGEALPMDGIVATSADAGVALRLPDGHSLRVDERSEIELRSDGSVALLTGALYLESDPAAPAGTVAVHTPLGVVQEIGTQFELRLRQRGLRIRLREGAVRLERPGRDHTVEAGTELNVDESGRVETVPIATHGPAWDWVSEVAAVPDFRGRSTHGFLEWIAREKGWTLAFADQLALRAAEETIVEGNVSRLTTADALEAVLRASRLDSRLAEGTLVVSVMP